MEPEQVQSARDRVGVHVAWEVLLLLGVVAAALAVRAESSDALAGAQLRTLALNSAVAMVLATAVALSLRAAVPNLAVGAIAVGTGALFGWLVINQGWTHPTAALLAAGAALVVGALLGLLVVLLRAPAWAVTFGAATVVGALALAFAEEVRVSVIPGLPSAQRWAWPLFGFAFGVSALGGLLGLVPRLRATLGSYRQVTDPAAGRGAGPGAIAAAALAGSALLAAGGGLIIMLQRELVVAGDIVGTQVTLVAFAAALLGGTSVHGRRGGLLGTALAAILIQLVLRELQLLQVNDWVPLLVVGGAALLGLLVTRLIEMLGTPVAERPLDETQPVEEGQPYGGYPPGYQPLFGNRYGEPDQPQYAVPDAPTAAQERVAEQPSLEQRPEPRREDPVADGTVADAGEQDEPARAAPEASDEEPPAGEPAVREPAVHEPAAGQPAAADEPTADKPSAEDRPAAPGRPATADRPG